MTSKFTLLAGASVGAAVFVFGAASAVAAKPVHHAKHVAPHRNSEIEALRAQVQALTARLDMQEANSAQATAAINTAQAQAAAATTTAQAAQVQAAAAQTAVPVEVKTALASQPKPKPQWFDSTSISGRMYFNFSNISAKSNGAKSAADGTGFNIKRFYLGVDHTFSPIFSANVTMDISNVVGSTSNGNFTANSTTAPAASTALVGRGFYVKKAYLQAKLNPALIIRAGSADLPWVPYMENQYGYRHIENVVIDRDSYGTSADWGVHVLGDLAGGLLSYQVSVIDGGGYRNVRVTKSVDVEGRVSAAYKGFWAAAGGYTGKRANDTQNLVLPTGLGHVRTATRLDAAGGYKDKLFTVGGEYFHAKNWNNTTTLAQDKAEGYSAFGNVNFAPKWSVFGRYDWVKPNELTNKNLHEHYYNAGIQWEPVKIVDLALTYKHDNVDNGTLSTQNGTIGGTNATGTLVGGHGYYNEVGIFGQLRF